MPLAHQRRCQKLELPREILMNEKNVHVPSPTIATVNEFLRKR